MTINGINGVNYTPPTVPQGSGQASPQTDTQNVTQAPDNPDYSVSISEEAQALANTNESESTTSTSSTLMSGNNAARELFESMGFRLDSMQNLVEDMNNFTRTASREDAAAFNARFREVFGLNDRVTNPRPPVQPPPAQTPPTQTPPVQTPPAQSPNTTTTVAANGRYSFSTVEGSFMLSFSGNGREADVARGVFFNTLFQHTHEEATAMAHAWSTMMPGGVGESQQVVNSRWQTSTVDAAVARHAELRDEIHRAFGNDSEQLELNLAALDRAFEGNMEQIARAVAAQAEADRTRAESMERNNAFFQATGQENSISHHTPHALANHSDFNRSEFERNSVNMMNQFAQFHLEQVRSGVLFGSGMEAVMNFLNSDSNLFGMTTSINNLSFSDFLSVNTSFMNHSNRAMTASEVNEEINRLNNEFNSGIFEQSDELRALLAG